MDGWADPASRNKLISSELSHSPADHVFHTLRLMDRPTLNCKAVCSSESLVDVLGPPFASSSSVSALDEVKVGRERWRRTVLCLILGRATGLNQLPVYESAQN